MSEIQQCAVPKAEVNLSIKLAPPTEYPPHHHSCICEMCSQYESIVLSKKLQKNSQEIFAKLKDRQTNSRINSASFEYVLKRLIIPNNKTIVQPICIYIPEVCFYRDGQADSLFMNVDQPDRGKNNQRGDSNKDRKQQMIVRLKKEKLNNTQIQKVFNQKRRKYRERVGTAIKRKLSRKVSQYGKKQEIPETKDAIIITYNDGYEQLQTQYEFINLTLKRKQDPIFKKIDFIKNFIGVSQEDKRVLIIKHEQQACKYQKLFQRSKTLMKCYASNIISHDRNYISPEEQNKFLEGLQKVSTDAYAHYNLYKIINYIELFYDEKVTQITVKFLLNECNDLYLLHVYSHKREQLIKYTWTQQSYLKRILEEENKFLKKDIKLDPNDEQGHARSQKIQKQMRNQYEQLKYAMGLAHVQENDSQEQANNAFFSVIYPELSTPISEILKDKGMTVLKFQEKYLGYKHKKRSVAQSFNSNLVKTLHKMTPPLKVAPGHQIQDRIFPKSPALTTNRTGKRSFSLGNTLSTVNKTMTIFL